MHSAAVRMNISYGVHQEIKSIENLETEVNIPRGTDDSGSIVVREYLEKYKIDGTENFSPCQSERSISPMSSSSLNAETQVKGEMAENCEGQVDREEREETQDSTGKHTRTVEKDDDDDADKVSIEDVSTENASRPKTIDCAGNEDGPQTWNTNDDNGMQNKINNKSSNQFETEYKMYDEAGTQYDTECDYGSLTSISDETISLGGGPCSVGEDQDGGGSPLCEPDQSHSSHAALLPDDGIMCQPNVVYESYQNPSDEELDDGEQEKSYIDLDSDQTLNVSNNQESDVYNYILDLEAFKHGAEENSEKAEVYSVSSESSESEFENKGIDEDIAVDSDTFVERIVGACKVKEPDVAYKNQEEKVDKDLDDSSHDKQQSPAKDNFEKTLVETDLNNNQSDSNQKLTSTSTLTMNQTCSEAVSKGNNNQQMDDNSSNTDTCSQRTSPDIVQMPHFSPEAVYGNDHVVGHKPWFPRPSSSTSNCHSTLNTPDLGLFEDADSNDSSWFARLSREIQEDPVSTSAFDSSLNFHQHRMNQSLPPATIMDQLMSQGRPPDISTWTAVGSMGSLQQTETLENALKPVCMVPPSQNTSHTKSQNPPMDTAVASNPFDDDLRNNNPHLFRPMHQHTLNYNNQFVNPGMHFNPPTVWPSTPVVPQSCQFASTYRPTGMYQWQQPDHQMQPNAAYSLNFASPVNPQYPVNFVSHPVYPNTNLPRPIAIHASTMLPQYNTARSDHHVLPLQRPNTLRLQQRGNQIPTSIYFDGHTGMWTRCRPQLPPQYSASRQTDINANRIQPNFNFVRTNPSQDRTGNRIVPNFNYARADTIQGKMDVNSNYLNQRTNTNTSQVQNAPMSYENTFDDISAEDTDAAQDVSLEEPSQNLTETANGNQVFSQIGEMGLQSAADQIKSSVSVGISCPALANPFNKTNLYSVVSQSVPATVYTGPINLCPVGSLPPPVPTPIRIQKHNQFSEIYVKKGVVDLANRGVAAVSNDTAMDLSKKGVRPQVSSSGRPIAPNVQKVKTKPLYGEPGLPLSALLNPSAPPAMAYNQGMLIPYISGIYSVMSDYKKRQELLSTIVSTISAAQAGKAKNQAQQPW